MAREDKNTNDLHHELAELRKQVAQLEAAQAEHRYVAKALQVSEERYRSLVTQSSDGVYIFDPRNASILEANQQFLKMLGYSEKEITSLSLYDILDTPREDIDENVRLVLRSGQFVSGLRRYKGKDGVLADVEINSTLISFRDTNVVMVNVRNVTERRRTEAELKAQAAMLREQAELLDITEDAIMVRDLNDRLIFWNRGAEKRYGWTADQAIGEVGHLLLRTTFPAPLEEIKEIVFHEGSWEGELLQRKADGGRLVVESHWALRRDKEGHPQAIMEINNDITRRKKVEEALQKAKGELEVRVSERTAELRSTNERLLLELHRRKRIEEMLQQAAARYSNLFQNSPMGIYRTDQKGRILMANQTLMRMLGYQSFDQLSGSKSKNGAYEPTYLKKRFISRLEKDDRVRGFEASWKRRDKSVIFVRENAKAVRGEDGAICFYEGTVEDISERKKAEEKIESYQKQLRSLASDLALAEESERRRIATILHDHIGQILALSKIKLGALIDLAKTSIFVENLTEIRTYVEQAITYTRSLTFELSPPVLYELGLEAAIEWLGEQIEEQHNIHFEFETDNRPKPISDEHRVFIFTAVRELLLNVVKHAGAQEAKVTMRAADGNLSIHVADNGVGFNAARMNFYLDENKGFGLFSIRERMHHLGGQVDIKSIRGRGTRVILSVPLSLDGSSTKRRANGHKNNSG